MKVKLKIFILVTSWIWLIVVGCFPQTDPVIPTPQVTPERTKGNLQDAFTDNPEPASLTPTKNPTESPTQVPTVLSTTSIILPTPDLDLEEEVENDVVSITLTATPTPTQEIDLSGNIYFRSSVGISHFSLETEEITDLITVGSEWDDLGLDISPDRQQLAYWLHKGNYSELWITELAQWSPELVFTISGVEHEWLGLWWVSDQYLLFEPGYFDQRNNFFIPAKSYLINILQQSVEIETGSLIFGCSLSVSRQSNQIATWCPAIEEWTDPQLYFTTPPSYYVVLEKNGEYWLSKLAPTKTFQEYRELPEDIWSWSYQGEHVAFSTYDEVAKARTLYYIDVQDQSLTTIKDDSRSYHSLDWSPDQQYISYVGDCSGRGCNKVFDIESQRVVWTSVGLPGAENGTYLNWSHDSKYIIVQSEGITIIDIKTGERICDFEDLSGSVIVWTP